MFGPETLAYMLFGMAALKSGFLTGQWTDRTISARRHHRLRHRHPRLYTLLVWLIFKNGFSVPALFAFLAATVLFRPVMVGAIAALIILLARRRLALTGSPPPAAPPSPTISALDPDDRPVLRLGLGLFGEFSRAQLWLVVIAMWVLMLAWSKPWLERFQYGPLEWLWRSLARWEVQPMRKRATHGSPPRPRSARNPGYAALAEAPRVRRCAAQQRVGRLVEQFQRLIQKSAQFDHVLDQFVGKRWVSMQKRASCFDLFGHHGQRLGRRTAAPRP